MMNRRIKSRSSSKGGGSNNMNRSIMMRKYGLDENQAYVEQSTLLEPNNFIPSWEAGDEEKKEVSYALRNLRLKYDAIHKLVKEKEDQLELIKKGVEKIGQEEHKVEQDTGGTHKETEQTKIELGSVKNTHEFECLYQSTYQHMLDRMKKDLIALQLQSNDLMESLRSKRNIMSEELNKQRKSKENKLQSKYRLDHLMKNIDHEQQKRQERILSLQTSIRNKEDALQKRMDRVRRQSEIAEAAANENKDSNEIKLRENYMVQKMWSQFFKKKMEKEMKKSSALEDAFQKIKSQTGNTDVQEIVHKFLTREHTYSSLLMTVSENEKKLEYLRKENDHKREELRQLQINFNSFQSQAVQKALNSVEAIKLNKEIAFLEKELSTINEKKNKIHLVGDQVGGWANRVVTKLNSQLLGENDIQINSGSRQKSILSLFNQIANVVSETLEDVINQQKAQEGEDATYITAKDFMNDFATEEFLTKNIRVRPISGVTGKDVEERQSEHISRNNLMGGLGDPTDDEEKFNKMINLEMEDQRKKLKLQREEIQRKKQQEAEKIIKQQQKKQK